MRKYFSFSEYLRRRFGEKVRRVSLDPAFPCPNKKGASGEGGCIYCDNSAFSGSALPGGSVERQLALGIERAIAGGVKKHIAYFQGSTPTNAPASDIKKMLDAVKTFPSVVAISVSTRPDCVNDEVLDLIAGYMKSYDVWIEYGLQSANNRTLELIGRGHTFEDAAAAAEKTRKRGIKTAFHVILGLPGEGAEDMINTAKKVSLLGAWGVKLHVLHVLKGTPLEQTYFSGGLKLFTAEEYASAACDFLENIPPDTVILRLVSDAREENLVAPKWINDKLKAINIIEKEFGRRGTFQGYNLRNHAT